MYLEQRLLNLLRNIYGVSLMFLLSRSVNTVLSMLLLFGYRSQYLKVKITQFPFSVKIVLLTQRTNNIHISVFPLADTIY